MKNKKNRIKIIKAVPETGPALDPALYDDLKPTMVAMVKKSISNRYIKSIKLTPEHGLSFEGKFDINLYSVRPVVMPGV